ncbi:hypothetical protein [Hasllibacter sp. MH4015]|uniref:hypothetical protein n=1 Tax=Hasllibacter sp. MH4015 TaxID=2854029 RepID=UPI001CD7DA42|nr:hypothetical protein [Hasllibacter sp. MH4015]
MRLTSLLPAIAPLVVASMAHAQAPTPEDHPGYPLAQAIAAEGCVLHQDDVNAVMEGIGVDSAMFPQMAVPLMQTGFLRPSGNGTLTLVNWGVCADLPAGNSGAEDAPEGDADDNGTSDTDG